MPLIAAIFVFTWVVFGSNGVVTNNLGFYGWGSSYCCRLPFSLPLSFSTFFGSFGTRSVELIAVALVQGTFKPVREGSCVCCGGGGGWEGEGGGGGDGKWREGREMMDRGIWGIMG